MIKVVFIRHGESVWNKKHISTGWTNISLSETGKKEAKQAGKVLKKEKYTDFDICFTSVLKRAHQTNQIVFKEIGKPKKVVRNWRLNERHYGALQGKKKEETANKYGYEKFFEYRRSYRTRPPALSLDDKRYPGNQKKYQNLEKRKWPRTESLKDVQDRLLPLWKKEILPEIKKGKKILVSASGNSLRALFMYLGKIPEKKIPYFNIPTAIPIVYLFTENGKPKKFYFLGNQKEAKRRIAKIAKEGKVKK